MTEATASPGTTSRFKPSFHFWLTCAMCGFVFAGFGMTYLFPLTAGDFPPAPPIVHLHALIFFSWMLLLLIQSARPDPVVVRSGAADPGTTQHRQDRRLFNDRRRLDTPPGRAARVGGWVGDFQRVCGWVAWLGALPIVMRA
jgi:hypothetical protein